MAAFWWDFMELITKKCKHKRYDALRVWNSLARELVRQFILTYLWTQRWLCYLNVIAVREVYPLNAMFIHGCCTAEIGRTYAQQLRFTIWSPSPWQMAWWSDIRAIKFSEHSPGLWGLMKTSMVFGPNDITPMWSRCETVYTDLCYSNIACMTSSDWLNLNYCIISAEGYWNQWYLSPHLELLVSIFILYEFFYFATWTFCDI